MKTAEFNIDFTAKSWDIAAGVLIVEGAERVSVPKFQTSSSPKE